MREESDTRGPKPSRFKAAAWARQLGWGAFSAAALIGVLGLVYLLFVSIDWLARLLICSGALLLFTFARLGVLQIRKGRKLHSSAERPDDSRTLMPSVRCNFCQASMAIWRFVCPYHYKKIESSIWHDVVTTTYTPNLGSISIELCQECYRHLRSRARRRKLVLFMIGFGALVIVAFVYMHTRSGTIRALCALVGLVSLLVLSLAGSRTSKYIDEYICDIARLKAKKLGISEYGDGLRMVVGEPMHDSRESRAYLPPGYLDRSVSELYELEAQEAAAGDRLQTRDRDG